MSNTTPSRALSKGTMGLKFMNRVAPSPIIARPVSPPPAVVQKVGVVVVVQKEVQGDVVMDGGKSENSSSTTERTVIHSGSLLSFPLLSSSSTYYTSTASYSSMPWTASVVSGRRSYGGANLEIEQLNNPSLASTSAPVPVESESASKKRKLLPFNTPIPRTPSASASSNAAFEGNDDEVKLGGGARVYAKKPRVEKEKGTPSNKFEKPAGFEGVKNGGPKAQKGNRAARREGMKQGSSSKKGGGGGGGDEEPVWGEKGEEREWDAGKNDAVDSEDDEEEEKAFTRAADAEEGNWEGGEGGSSGKKGKKGKKDKKGKGKKV